MSSLGQEAGYGLLAATLARDHDLCIFRRFASLNMRNLLYMQSELQSLELKLEQLDAESNDPSKGNDIWARSRSWYRANKYRAASPTGGHEEYWDVVLKIRNLLVEYNTALQKESWLQSLKKPSPESCLLVQRLVKDDGVRLAQADAEYITEKHRQDLRVLSWHKKEILGTLLSSRLKKFFKKRDDYYRHDTIGFISEERVSSVVRLVVISVSALLPVASIVVLFVISSDHVRLGVIAIFSVLCSLAMAILTNARNTEVLAITFAYAAVQVVFLGINGNRC